MIPQELDELIKIYLTDGIISPKERAVILKKAEKMGLDVDEIELYIDAQQQKIDQEIDAATRKKKGKSCPFCGAPVPMLTDKCPSCGQFITPEASKELTEIIEHLEDALVEYTADSNKRNRALAERYIRKAELYYSNNPRVKVLLSNYKSEISQKEHEAKLERRRRGFFNILKSGYTYGILFILIGILIGIIFEFDFGDIAIINGILWPILIGAMTILVTIARADARKEEEREARERQQRIEEHVREAWNEVLKKWEE